MNIKSNVRWSIYLLLLTVNALFLVYSVLGAQSGSDISDDLYSGVAIYFNRNKPNELLGYLIGASLLFLIYIINVVARTRTPCTSTLRSLARASLSLQFRWHNGIHYFHMIVLPILAVSFINDLKPRVFVLSYVLLYTLLNM